TANSALNTLVTFLENTGHFDRGEKVLRAQLQRLTQQQQTSWLTHRLFQLFHRALQDGGEVSLGKGQALYQVLQQRLQDDLATVDQDHRSNQVNLLLTVYRTAHEKKYPGVIDDLKTFASKRLPQVLRQQTNHYETIVGSVAGTIHDLASPRDGMAFLLD